MRALSIRQPWAWAILNGKDIENRSRRTNFRGAFLIHAAKKVDFEGYLWLKQNREALRLPVVPSLQSMQRGGIIGQANITGCVKSSKSKWFMGRYGYKLSKVRPVDFYPCRGQLGFFEVKTND